MSNPSLLQQQGRGPLGGSNSETVENGFMPRCTPGPVGFNDASSCDSGIAADWVDIILTSNMPVNGLIKAEYVDIVDRGNTYKYGCLYIKKPYQQALHATAKKKGKTYVLDPQSPQSSFESPMKYYSPWKPEVDCANAVYKSAKKLGRRPPRGDAKYIKTLAQEAF